MKKVHKSKRQKKPKRLGTIAHIMRFLDHWYTMALADKKKRGEGVAILEFVKAHQQPFKERGDLYLGTLNAIRALLPAPDRPRTDLQLVHELETDLAHLQELLTDRLNYDDMRAALEKLHTTPYRFWMTRRMLLEITGASKALIGAPVSDAGEMRRTLQAVDAILMDLVKSIDVEAPLPTSKIVAIWDAIHTARKALKAVEGYRSAPPVGIMDNPVVDGGQL